MPRAGLTTARVAQLGAELADEHGLEALTVSALARSVGVQPPSLYSHVSSTQDLRLRVGLLALEEMADRAADAVAGRSGGDALRALADTYRDYAAAHPGRYAASRNPMDDATAAGSAGPRHAALILAVLRGYELPDTEHVHAVRLVGSTVHGFIELQQAGSFDHSDPPPAASWSRVLQALDAALRAWGDD